MKKINDILLPLLSRLFIYVSGFLYLLVLSLVLDGEQFGYYSILQSVIELCIVFNTLGTLNEFYRAGIGKSQFFPILRALNIIICGSLASLIVFLCINFFFYHWMKDYINFAIFTSAAISLLMMIFNWLRGKGRILIFSLESGLRSSFSMLVILLAFNGYGYKINQANLLFVNLLSVIIILLWTIYVNRDLIKLVNIEVSVKKSDFFGLVLNFFVKKGDLLILASFSNVAFIALYKIAFILSEAIYQFIISVNLKNSAKIKNEFENPILFKKGVAVHNLLIAIPLAIAALMFVIGYEILNKKMSGVLNIFLPLAFYFLVKSYTIFHEQIIIIFDRGYYFMNKSIIDLFIKLLTFYVFHRLNFRIEFSYVILAGAELVVSEIMVYKISGRFYFLNDGRYENK